MKIPITKPSIKRTEIKYILDAAKNGWGKNCYDYINKFEHKLSKYLGVKYVIATSSCFGAIYLSLKALNIKKGDEVILADINWIATVAPIVHLNAKPVFVDIDPVTWCVDPREVEKKINKNTKAIIAVHLYGNICDVKSLKTISKKYKIPLVEDAAEALGSSINKRKVGTFGDFGCYSFHGTKTITTGEGGALVTNNKKLYRIALKLSDHGKNEKKQFWSDLIGFKFKMSNLQAALGYAQIMRINQILKKKIKIFNLYKKYLVSKNIFLNPTKKDEINSYWMPTIILKKSLKIKREHIFRNLKKYNVDSRVFFYPLSILPMFRKIKKNKISYNIYKRGFNLPSYYDLSENKIKLISKILNKYIS